MGASNGDCEPPHRILVADDDPAALRLLLLAFEELDPTFDVTTVFDGQEAVDALSKRSDDEPLPDVVVLDIDMPKRTGLEVLEEIRTTPRLQALPVVIFSQRDDAEIIEAAYQLGASAYLTKPPDYDGLIEASKTISEFCGFEASNHTPKGVSQ